MSITIKKQYELGSGYVIMPNAWARDQRLKNSDKGLLVLLMSLSEGFNTSARALAAMSTDGIDSVKTAAKRLEKYGYLTRARARDSRGKLTRSVWVLHEPKTLENTDISPKAEKPTLEKPTLEKPTLENPPSKEEQLLLTNNLSLGSNNSSLEEQNLRKTNLSCEIENSENSGFESWWKKYPPRRGAKAAAAKAYTQALKHTTPQQLLTALEAWQPYFHERQTAGEERFIPHATTWLNQKRWQDEPPQPRPHTTGNTYLDHIHANHGQPRTTPWAFQNLTPGGEPHELNQ